MDMHSKMADALDQAMDEIKAIQKNARENDDTDQTEVANDRTSYPKGMDRTKGSGWQADRRLFPCTSGSDHDGQTGASSDVKRLVIRAIIRKNCLMRTEN